MGMCGRMWYPAKVCILANVPENMRNLFHNDRQKPILKWYDENNYSLVKESKVQHPLQRTKLMHKGPVGLPTSRFYIILF